MLRLRDIMTTDVVTVGPESTIREAMELLAARHLGGAPVVAGSKVVGVISLSDLVTFAASLPGASAQAWSVEEEPSEASEDFDAAEGSDEEEGPGTSLDGSELERDAELGGRFEELEFGDRNALEEHTVAEAMTRALHWLPPDAFVDEAARRMREVAVHRLLVMEHGELVGLVTTKDIADAVADRRLETRTYVFDRPRASTSARG